MSPSGVKTAGESSIDQGPGVVIFGSQWDAVGSFGIISVIFTGQFRRSLDDKSRLPIPKPLREAMPPMQGLYLTFGLDGCLALYPADAFEAIAASLASSPAAREVREYSRLFYAQACRIQVDRQGRLRIPPELVKAAELKGEVVVVGVRNCIEIWSATRWDEYMARCGPQYDALAEQALGSGIRRAADVLPEVTDPIAAILNRNLPR